MKKRSVGMVLALLLVSMLGSACKKAEPDTAEAEEPSTATSEAPDIAALPPAVPSAEMPLTIQTSLNADENLFLLHLLGHYYESMPDADAGLPAMTAWLTFAKQNMASVRNVIRARGLDQDIDTLYADGQRSVTALEDFLTNIGAIQRQRSNQNAPDVLAGIWEGYQTGSKAGRIAKGFGSSEEDAGDLGALVGLIAGAAEVAERQKQHDEEQAAALQAQESAVKATWTETGNNARRTAGMLASRYGWSPGEAGFDGFSSKYLGEYMKHRPRDPFAIIRYANTRPEKETPEDTLRDAQRCLAAAELVPASTSYDTIRNEFVLNGAELAAMAASVESTRGGHSQYSARPRLAEQVLSFSNTYLSRDPVDATGRGHMVLARGLAFSGRYQEAATAATEALNKATETWQNDANFCYRYAAILSLAGDRVDLVGSWLKQGFAKGLDVRSVRDSPDLANYRQAYPDEYKALTTVNLTYKIEFGFFNDDIIFTNQSPFKITTLDGTVTIRQGQTEWSPKVKCGYIAPGGSCKMVDAVSIPGSRYDEVSSSVTCDQCVG